MTAFNEFMLRVSWSTDKHPDQEGDEGQVKHCRRGEVMLDLGLPFTPGDDFTADEMQLVARAAKMQALKVLRLRDKPPRHRLDECSNCGHYRESHPKNGPCTVDCWDACCCGAFRLGKKHT